MPTPTLMPGDTRGPRVDMTATGLRHARELAGLTQLELAISAGLTPSTISRLETGRQVPNVATVLRLAAALRIDPAKLIGPAPHYRPGRSTTAVAR